MRLAVSNIAWPAEHDSAAYALLREAGVTGLEVAPTRFWPGWEGASTTAMAGSSFRDSMTSDGICVTKSASPDLII